MNVKLLLMSILFVAAGVSAAEDLASLKQNENISDFRVANLYADSSGKIVGAKLIHIQTRAPIYLLQIETAPQMFMWIDAPATSNRGLAHSLEHLLARKGTKGRYLNLLRLMRFGQSGAASYQDYNMYTLNSGTGISGFEEEFSALLGALFKPDFTDVEAEREFYHIGISSDATTGKKSLVEQGTVYNEEQTGQRIYDYYFALNKEVFGGANPFAFDIGGLTDEMRNVAIPEIRDFHLNNIDWEEELVSFLCSRPKRTYLAFSPGYQGSFENFRKTIPATLRQCHQSNTQNIHSQVRRARKSISIRSRVQTPRIAGMFG